MKRKKVTKLNHHSHKSKHKTHSEPHSQNESLESLESVESVQEKVTLLAEEKTKKKWENWWVRSLWTFVMISIFTGILMAGHLWVILLIIGIQFFVYREVISIGLLPVQALKVLPWLRSVHWYFFAVSQYFLYIESLIFYCKPSTFVERFLMPFAVHHRLISFLLYMGGFVTFVLNLKKGFYRFQFYHFCWTHMTLLLVLCSSHFIINNIFEGKFCDFINFSHLLGLFWFIFPVSLVIVNDITAYIFGFFFGKTPLIRLSPKKTWEGFMGAFICTFIFAYFFSGLLSQYPYFTCPVENLSTSSLSLQTCRTNLVFVPLKMDISPKIMDLIRSVYPSFHWNSFTFYPVQLHSLLLAAFASLVAPFGGFFASGFKRAFNIKDFGHSIPGHGGLTDRMDCQFLMGVFSYIYFQSFIGAKRITVLHVFDTIILHLTREEQLELIDKLKEYLLG